ncbi:MAG: hypothetical protein R3275_00800 [Saprospiraceae bacterium]|nr:hypothetical protein [Saprospiraceae bacterium]
MLKNNPILRFALLFLLTYFILTAVVSWMGMDSGINSFFRGISKSTLSLTMSELKFNTKPERQNGILNDNKMIVEFEWTEEKIQEAIQEARRTGKADIEVPYRFISYLIFEFFVVPFLFLISLILATPMQWRLKLTNGLIACLIMLAFLLVKLYIMTLFSVSKARIDVYELSDGTMDVLLTVVSMLTMGFSIIIAFFLWLIFIFRNSHLKRLMQDWFTSIKGRMD